MVRVVSWRNGWNPSARGSVLVPAAILTLGHFHSPYNVYLLQCLSLTMPVSFKQTVEVNVYIKYLFPGLVS